MRFMDYIFGLWEKFSSIRYYAPSVAEPEEKKYVELTITGIGSDGKPMTSPLSGEDKRRKQRNSKKRTNQLSEGIDDVQRAWRRAWKYKRRDAHLSEWPRLDIGMAIDDTRNERCVYMNGWESMLDEGFRHSFVRREGEYGDSEWERGTYIFAEVATISMSSASRLGRCVIDHARWFVEQRGVVVPPKGRPWGFSAGMAIAPDGTTLIHEGEKKRPRIIDICTEEESDTMSLVVLSAVLNLRRKTYWDLDLSTGNCRFKLPVDRVSAREILFDREREGKKRRSAAFHWVKSHKRSNGAVVPAHLRGAKDFNWHGWSVALSESNHDVFHRDIGTLPEFDLKRFFDENIQDSDDTGYIEARTKFQGHWRERDAARQAR